ncbi:MAG: chemotaxis protein [Sediminibacterium sp.]|nr:chemotaxis protein [Sediminibacterium sp.]
MRKQKEEKIAQSPHHIVGIGASAGGMEALHELFDNMPPDTGFSFVVIQHLSPDYKSLMSELLAKHTMMQVFEATEGMPVKPNCVYVIPSKVLLTVKQGRLRLTEKIKNNQPNNAIDVFLESLAHEKLQHAIAIILSGTGTDGTKGIECIKLKGGLVIVQEPLSAAFDGMPTSAIASGFTDLVLTPEMIPDEMCEYLKESPLLKTFNEFSQKEEMILREVLLMVKQITGNDFTHYKRPTLFRRLAKRMSELNLRSIEEYKSYAAKNSEELQVLGREFLINVTRFFRDQDAFDQLRTQVIPAIFTEKKAKEQVKVWSVACSSGEEAYTTAMLFCDYMERNKLTDIQVKIFATDIDTQALETASRGVYGKQAEKEVPAFYLQKYFVKEGDQYRIITDIRKMVVFAKHDILKDPPFSKMDLVMCRNMLIYFDPYLQGKALQKIHFALNLDSFLFLGSSENEGILSTAMEEVNRKWKIYQCVSKKNMTENETFVLPPSAKLYPSIPTNPKNALNNLAEILKDTLMEDRIIAGIFTDKEFNVKQAIGNFKNFLEFPDGNFNFNLLKMVVPDMAVALGVHVRKAVATNQKVVVKKVALHEPTRVRYVNIIIKPYLHPKDYSQPFLFIVLEEQEPGTGIPADTEHVQTIGSHAGELEKELRETRENLQAIIEELESANEELQSSNEEMISTSEELQSTNEELQSLNEELHTVSAEHQSKIKELMELNDDLHNYFRNSEIGQIFIDKKMIVRKFSPSVSSIVNLISTDIGRSLVDITLNVQDLNFINDIKQVIKSSYPVEKEIILNDHRHFLMRISPYVKRDQSIDGTVINFIDITESKKLSGIIEGVFNSSVNGITAKRAVRNKQGKITDFEYLAINKAYEELFGKTARGLIGKTLKQVFPDVAKSHMDMCIEVVEKGKNIRSEHYQQSTDRWLETIAVKMFDGIVTTHSDITEKKKSSEVLALSYQELKNTSEQLVDSNTQLERSNMDLMQFASVASHDLKEPLRKIQVFANILQEKSRNKFNEDEMTYLNKIIRASGRMQTLIEDVLTLSKLSNNELPRAPIDLAQVIASIKEDLEITIKEKNAEVEIGELPVIPGVHGQLHQVFQNLISNSLKFNKKEVPKITIVEKPLTGKLLAEACIPNAENCACIQVQDNGIGFEGKYADKVFGIFQRLNGRQFDGTGIGLAIVKKIVENHGGCIRAKSAPEKGTTFTIYLPK